MQPHSLWLCFRVLCTKSARHASTGYFRPQDCLPDPTATLTAALAKSNTVAHSGIFAAIYVSTCMRLQVVLGQQGRSPDGDYSCLYVSLGKAMRAASVISSFFTERSSQQIIGTAACYLRSFWGSPARYIFTRFWALGLGKLKNNLQLHFRLET